MSVSEFLESEIVEKKRTTLVSNLVRKFGQETNILTEIEKFVSSCPEKVRLMVSETSEVSDGSLTISIVASEKVTDRLFALHPRDSNESNSAVFKRDMETVRSEILGVKPGLWVPRYSLIEGPSCEERVISVIPQTQTKANMPSTSQQHQSKPDVSAVSKPQPVKPSSTATSKPSAAPVSKPAASAVGKFQIPLDKLDDPNDKFVEKEMPAVEEEKENSSHTSDVVIEQIEAPQVVSVSSESSPVAKRQRTDPEYREVVIKKKMIVTEYEMGPNGEMIVKDVEKMVEEKKMELVRPSVAVSQKSGSSASSGARKEPKPAKPGQSTLAGFFKPKN